MGPPAALYIGAAGATVRSSQVCSALRGLCPLGRPPLAALLPIASPFGLTAARNISTSYRPDRAAGLAMCRGGPRPDQASLLAQGRANSEPRNVAPQRSCGGPKKQKLTLNGHCSSKLLKVGLDHVIIGTFWKFLARFIVPAIPIIVVGRRAENL